VPAAPAAGQAPASATPATLAYVSPSDTVRQQGEREMFDRFTAEVPQVRVDLSPAPDWPAAKEKFLVAGAGGTPIHVAQGGWGGTWLDMWDRGAIVDLAPYFKRDKLSPDATFLEGALFQWRDGPVIGGLPITSSILALAYNRDLLTAAGLRPPPVDPAAAWWTVESFLDYAKRLTDRNADQYGFGGTVGSGNGSGLTNGTYFGLTPWNDARRKCLLDTAEYQRALQFWKDVRHLHRVQPSDEEAARVRAGASGDLFLTGKIGMQVVFNITQTALPFKWELATLPYAGPGGSKNTAGTINTHGLVMGKVSEGEREAAWLLYRWLLKPENGGLFPRTAGHAVSPLKDPAATEVAQRLYRERFGIDPKAYALHAQGAMVYSAGMSKYANWAQCQTAVEPRYTELMANRLAVMEYATFATRYYDDNLAPRA
jgi:multiple sugar transport system substrate-binding protein